MTEGKKYELFEQHASNKLWHIRALRSFGNVSKGDIGGWVESEDNLSQDGNAWVSGNARVSGNAWVSGGARVSGDARVYGGAWVSGNAWVHHEKHTDDVWTLTLGKHTITVDGNHLNIGCESHTIGQWLKNYREIGDCEGYSPEEIERYGDAITMISKWMGRGE